MAGNGDRTALARFGGGRHWSLPDGTKLDVGELIASAGPGEGVTLLPWALDRYERALGLTRDETWLLKRLLKHAWTADTPVYFSIRKITREANITRNTVKAILSRLEARGYIVPLDSLSGDQRRRYTVRPFYDALALCIACDPESEWAKEHGVLPPDVARRLRGSDGAQFDLDLEIMTERQNGHRVEEVDLSWWK